MRNFAFVLQHCKHILFWYFTQVAEQQAQQALLYPGLHAQQLTGPPSHFAGIPGEHAICFMGACLLWTLANCESLRAVPHLSCQHGTCMSIVYGQ